MRRNHRIAMTAVMTTGLVGVSGAAMTQIPFLLPESAPVAVTAVDGSAAERAWLQQTQAALLLRRQTLQHDLVLARLDLASAHKRQAAAAAAAIAAQSQAQAPQRIITVQSAPTAVVRQASRPTTHTRTGASGAAAGAASDDGGGTDD